MTTSRPTSVSSSRSDRTKSDFRKERAPSPLFSFPARRAISACMTPPRTSPAPVLPPARKAAQARLAWGDASVVQAERARSAARWATAADARVALARPALAEDDHTAAVDAFDTAREPSPESAPMTVSRAGARAALRRTAKAAKVHDRVGAAQLCAMKPCAMKPRTERALAPGTAGDFEATAVDSRAHPQPRCGAAFPFLIRLALPVPGSRDTGSRAVRPLSAHHARQPISTASVGGGRHHAGDLAPQIDELGDIRWD